MSEISTFESRTGNLSCTAKEFYSFMTDFRNIRQFIPEQTLADLHVEKESISFRIAPVGNVNMRLIEKEPVKKILCSGIALNTNNFTLLLRIEKNTKSLASVNVTMNVEMSPVMKMIASQPLERFLGVLIDEMEKFSDWGTLCE